MISYFDTNVLSNHQLGLIICRSLQSVGAITENQLFELIVPLSSRDKSDTAKMTVQWRDTMVLLREHRLVIEADNQLLLGSGFLDLPIIEHVHFSSVFLQELVKSNVKYLDANGDVDGMFKSLLWLTSLPDGYTFASFSDNTNNCPYQKLKAFGLGEVIDNDEKWRSFRRWARGLGLVKPLTRNVDTVDLTSYIAQVIKLIEVDESVDSFVSKICDRLPLIIDVRLKDWLTMNGKNLDPYKEIPEQLSWALFCLRERGVIELRTEDDVAVDIAPAYRFPVLSEGSQGSFTHIRKLENK
jgi:hypothetical protein